MSLDLDAARPSQLSYPARVGLAPGPRHKLDAVRNHGEDAVVSQLLEKAMQWHDLR
jgi:hypothetical protein